MAARSSSRARGAVPGTGDDGQGDELDGPEYVDEHHAAIAEFAAQYLDEDERDKFVNHLMERRGYQRVESWAPPAGGDGQDLDDGQGDDPGDGQGDELDDRRRGRSSTAAGTAAGAGGTGQRAGRRPGYFKR